MERFNEIIFDLGKIVALPLFVDKNRACRLIINERFPIQIEMNEEGNKIFVASTLYEIPPGKFREEVLKQALKENLEIREKGYFLAYIEDNNSLTLIVNISPIKLSGEKLATALENFIECATLWKDALESGSSSPNIKPIQEDGKDFPFGMKP